MTDRQRPALFDLPTDEAVLVPHGTFADDDIEHIRAWRKPENLLCLAAQLGMNADDLADHAIREETRRDHLVELRTIYDFRMLFGRGAGDLKVWLEQEAENSMVK